jgi:hypothetical protein
VCLVGALLRTAASVSFGGIGQDAPGSLPSGAGRRAAVACVQFLEQLSAMRRPSGSRLRIIMRRVLSRF